MTELGWLTRVLCKMTNFCGHWITYGLLMTLNLNSYKTWIFVYHSIKPWGWAKQVGLVRQGSCPSQCQKSQPDLGDLFKPTTLFKSNFHTVQEHFKVRYVSCYETQPWSVILKPQSVILCRSYSKYLVGHHIGLVIWYSLNLKSCPNLLLWLLVFIGKYLTCLVVCQ